MHNEMVERSVWLAGVEFPSTPTDLALPARSDVVIIGAGITGLAAARVLARRGLSVAVLEAQSIGWGASSRNGGMVLTGLKLGVPDLLKQHGPELTRRMFKASLASIDCVERIVSEEALDCDFRRSGHLLAAYKPGHLAAMQSEAELIAREYGHPTRFVPRERLHEELGSPAYHGGLVDEASAGINPARYVAGLACAALRAGALLFDHTPAQRITRQGSEFWVATPRGMLRAGAVLLATGGYTDGLHPRLQRRVFPLGSYVIATEVLPARLAQELSPRNRMIFDSKHLLFYFRLTPDRRLLFGGRAAFFPASERSVRKSASMLRRDMLFVYPQLRDVRVEYAWGGVLDVTFDVMPHVGQLDGVYHAVGYAGHGVAMASYLGGLVAAQIAGEQVDNPFAELRFPHAPLGLYNGRPWFLPLAAGWYKLQDVLH
jgi:glycine/D-amino acid oxidase-like deaminating enzyme